MSLECPYQIIFNLIIAIKEVNVREKYSRLFEKSVYYYYQDELSCQFEESSFWKFKLTIL